MKVIIHTGTHMDALSHATIGEDSHWFGGFNETTSCTGGVLHADGAAMLPFFTRGVLLDVAAYKGVLELERGSAITPEDIAGTAKMHGVEIRKSDTVLIHTGYSDNFPNVDYDKDAHAHA